MGTTRWAATTSRRSYDYGQRVEIDYLPSWPTWIRFDPSFSDDNGGNGVFMLIWGGMAALAGAVIVLSRSSRRS